MLIDLYSANSTFHEKQFTVCTLVTNIDEYHEMVSSFKNAGFEDEFTEFLYIDNSHYNVDDAFSGLNKFLNLAKGKYIIICHQDILLKFDDISILKQCILQVDTLDPNWAILGNAGFASFTQKYYRISDPWGENITVGDLPAKVKSLDENFLLIKNEANLALSRNLKGFHMYGTDLCTIASFLGWNAYVINFHLYHKSPGNCDTSFFEARNLFMRKYRHLTKPLFIRTTCTSMIITRYAWLNSLLNRKFIYSIKKRLDTITEKFNHQETDAL